MKKLLLIVLIIPLFCHAQPIDTTWHYYNGSDQMTSKSQYYAEIASTNKLSFAFPYDGGSTATIVARNDNGRNNIMLSVDKGQFTEGALGKNVLIKFDDGKPVSFSYSYTTDGKVNVIFINGEKRLINLLKNSHKIKVQAEFYQEGLNVMEFNVSGFKWPY